MISILFYTSAIKQIKNYNNLKFIINKQFIAYI